MSRWCLSMRPLHTAGELRPIATTTRVIRHSLRSVCSDTFPTHVLEQLLFLAAHPNLDAAILTLARTVIARALARCLRSLPPTAVERLLLCSPARHDQVPQVTAFDAESAIQSTPIGLFLQLPYSHRLQSRARHGWWRGLWGAQRGREQLYERRLVGARLDGPRGNAEGCGSSEQRRRLQAVQHRRDLSLQLRHHLRTLTRAHGHAAPPRGERELARRQVSRPHERVGTDLDGRYGCDLPEDLAPARGVPHTVSPRPPLLVRAAGGARMPEL